MAPENLPFFLYALVFGSLFSLFAYRAATNTADGTRWFIVLTSWWFLQEGRFNDEGARACRAAKGLVLANVLLIVLWVAAIGLLK